MEIPLGLKSLLDSFSEIYTDFTVAVVILLFGIVLGKIAGKLILRLLHELEINKLVKKTTKSGFPIEELISSGTSYTIYFIFIVLSLQRMRLNPLLFDIIAVAIIAIIVISILLAIKDLIPNFIAGISIHFSNHIRDGDTIMINDIKGKVSHVGMIETRLETRRGDTIYVPNSLLTKSIVRKKRRRKRLKKN